MKGRCLLRNKNDKFNRNDGTYLCQFGVKGAECAIAKTPRAFLRRGIVHQFRDLGNKIAYCFDILGV